MLDDRHAAYVDWCLGIANRNGIAAEPMTDEQGERTNTVRIPMPVGDISIIVVVPCPPDGWQPDPADFP